jgi:hypothetical protein
MLIQLAEEERQVLILALTELKQRRPGWEEWLDDLIDRALSGRQIRIELERLYAEVATARRHDGSTEAADTARDEGDGTTGL